MGGLNMDPENVQKMISEVNLPGTVNDLRNPTEQYVVSLLKQFLTNYGIDVNVSMMPTPKQLDALSPYNYDPEMISLINLSEIMAKLDKQIFHKDFHVTEIINPTSRSIRVIALLLANFTLFAISRSIKIQKVMNEQKQKRERLQELDNERSKYFKLMNDKIQRNEKLESLDKQLEAEIEKESAMKAERKLKLSDIQDKLNVMDKELEEQNEHRKNLAAETDRILKIVQNIESKIAPLPEHQEALRQDLLEQKKKLNETRQVMEEAAASKKLSMKKTENRSIIIDAMCAKMSESLKELKDLVQTKKDLEKTENDISELISQIKEKESEISLLDDDNFESRKAEIEKVLPPLYNQLNKLLIKKKNLQRKLINDQAHHKKIVLETDDVRIKVEKMQEETKEYLAYSQELYDEEINEERTLRSIIEKSLANQSQRKKITKNKNKKK